MYVYTMHCLMYIILISAFVQLVHINNYRITVIVTCLLVKQTATIAAFFDLSGSPAPSRLPTLIPIAIPMPKGI